jgi:GT2 family glycosyltransferase
MLSIIILNYKAAGLLKYCLRSILRHPPSRPYEIIVVDNASGDGAEKLQPLFPAVRFLLLRENHGYAAGNNEGIAVARGNRICVLNPDIVVFPESFDKLLAALDDDSTLGVVGPKLLNPDRTLQYSCNRFYTPLTPLCRRTALGRLPLGRRILQRDLMMDVDHDHPMDVDWLMGSALLLRRDALDAVGPLDERYFMYFEDMDWCRRFWHHGWKVRYVPEATMVHFHQRASAQSFWRFHARVHIASAAKYFLKHGFR